MTPTTMTMSFVCFVDVVAAYPRYGLIYNSNKNMVKGLPNQLQLKNRQPTLSNICQWLETVTDYLEPTQNEINQL
jgi:hypothetical protein